VGITNPSAKWSESHDTISKCRFVTGDSLTRTQLEIDMRKIMFAAAVAVTMAAPDAGAQVELRTYADAKGFLDVQKLTCAQLANTYQEDADLLMAWYSGWYNGLAKKHLANPERAKRLEHEVIVHCKANPGIRIIDAIAVVFKDERMRLGIKMKAQ
jgi:hypothetical protein